MDWTGAGGWVSELPVRRIPKQPGAYALGCISPKGVAERARFELAIPFWGTHAFQACLFSHSSISPIRIRGLSVKTGLQR